MTEETLLKANTDTVANSLYVIYFHVDDGKYGYYSQKFKYFRPDEGEATPKPILTFNIKSLMKKVSLFGTFEEAEHMCGWLKEKRHITYACSKPLNEVLRYVDDMNKHRQ